MDTHTQITTGIPAPKSPTLATDKLNPAGLDSHNLVRIETQVHRGDDVVRNAASDAAAKAAQAMATVDLHLPVSDH